jgi:hypothetical protein
VRDQALRELSAGTVKDRGKLVSLAVQASMSLGDVFLCKLFMADGSWTVMGQKQILKHD